jgi:hypothetical protein
MLRARCLIATGVAVVAAAAGLPGSALADAGGSPAPHANCVGMANAGGANGAFVRSIEPGSNARDFGTGGGAGLPASSNDCGLS